ncbi:hypothetical protein R3P38DRAFT_2418957, partial [Favolaschia claudopus]
SLTVEIPTNSDVIGAPLVMRTKQFKQGTPFERVFPAICQVASLDPATAWLGYKWDNDAKSAPVLELATAVDWDNCMKSGFGQMQRARKRHVMCIIHNLV